jgi:hypothetical protein
VTEAIEKAGGASAGFFLYGPSTMFGQHAPVMPDEDTARLALRTADQLRTDLANLECVQEFLMQQINRLPTARDLWRVAMLIAFVSAVLGIVGIEAFWHYFPACGWN